MFGFSKPDHRSVIAVDIGSSSVGIAVICVHPDQVEETIWVHRELCLIHDDASAEVQIKQIKTALTNAFLELHQAGMAALRATDHTTEISEVQATVSAPWSHTITKTITFTDSNPFTFDEELAHELVAKAHEQNALVFASNTLAKTLGLHMTHAEVLGVTINGYPTADPINKQGTEVNLTHMETAISEGLLETLKETVEKFFPKAEHNEYSFMYVYYLTMHHLQPNTSEICLIDVTGEATEVGIVRDDVLRYSTFIPYGINTIAREISTASGLPKAEVVSYMKEPLADLESRLPQETFQKVSDALDDYEEQVANMFARTGDNLSIPKTTFLHSNEDVQPFFINVLEAAAKKATKESHQVHPVTNKVLGLKKHTDTALEMSINFLAKKGSFTELLPTKIEA